MPSKKDEAPKLRKRGQGEGSIYQRADGMWCAAVSTPQGRKVAYATTRKAVVEKLQQLQRAALGGMPITRKDLTVKELLAEYLEHKKSGWRPKSYELAEGIIRLHVVSALGSVRLADLDVRTVSAWVRGLGNTRTALIARMHLGAACDMAMRYEWLSRNPVRLTSAPSYRPARAAEVDGEKVLDYLAAMEPTPAYPLLAVLAGCGLRISEALGLCWSDWSPETNTLTVHRQLGRTEGGKGEFGLMELKTKASRRVVSVAPFAAAALERQRERQDGFKGEIQATGNAWGNEWGLIFTSQVGTPLIYTDLRRVVQGHAAKQGVEPIRFHDLRHAYASLLIGARLPIPVISASMGHANPQITMSTYAHKLKGTDSQTADAIQEIWKRGKK